MSRECSVKNNVKCAKVCSKVKCMKVFKMGCVKKYVQKCAGEQKYAQLRKFAKVCAKVCTSVNCASVQKCV